MKSLADINGSNFISVTFIDGDVYEAMEKIAALGDPKKKSEVMATLRKGYRKAGAYLIRAGRKREKASIRANQAKWPNVRHTGNLLSSFRTKVKRSGAGMLVGFNKKGSHSWLVDQGHTGERSHNGFTQGSHFWEDTRSNDAPKAQQMVADSIREAVYSILG